MSGFEWFLVIVVVILVPLAIAVGVTLWTLELARQRNRRNRPDPKPTGVARKATRPAERSSAVPVAADADCGGLGRETQSSRDGSGSRHDSSGEEVGRFGDGST